MSTQKWRRLHTLISPTALLAALCLTGCYSETDYESDYTQAICDKTFECYDDAQQENLAWDSAEVCYEDWQVLQTDSETCLFDSDAAQLCVAETQELTCSAFYSGAWPESCESVCGE